MASTKPPISRPGPIVKGPDIDVRLVPPEYEFPPWWQAARDLLADVSDRASQRQLTTAAEGSLIPVTVGTDRIGADITDVFVYGTKLVIMATWGVGPYEAIEDLHLGDAPFTGTVRHYLGANIEALDPTLGSQRSKYIANPLDIAFSVLEIPKTAEISSLEITARILGRNDVYDPRIAGDAWTDNPSLITGWYVTKYLGETVNATDLETCADFNDEALGVLSGSAWDDRGIYRRRIGLTAAKPQKKGRWLSVIQEYAQIFLTREGSEVRMIPATDAAPVASIGPNDVVEGSWTKEITGLSRVPNMVTVVYTDANDTEWKDAPVSTPTPIGVPIREQRVSMPGIQSKAQATRYGIERLNKYTLARQVGSFTMLDDGIKYLRGEILSVTDVEGAVAKAVRILDIDAQDKTAWRYRYIEHDPAITSDVLVDEPSVSDTTLPNPNVLPAVTGLAGSIKVPQFKSGIYFSSIRATWDELDNYPFERTFEVLFKQGAAIVGSVMTTELEATFGPLQEGLEYVVTVTPIGVFGARGSAASSPAILVTGKDLPPTNVPNFTAFGVGGEVRLRWDASADNQAIWRYEIRYGASGVTWEAATFLTRTDSLSHTTTELAAGTWDLLIKAIDNAFNESAAASVIPNVEVDQSSDIFLLDSAEAVEATNSGMIEFEPGSWITDSGESWNSLFPGLMNTYVNPVWSYQTPGATSLTSTELDPAVGLVSGAWQASPNVEVISGTPTSELETYNGSTWDAQGANSVVAEAYKSRWKISGSGAVYIVTEPISLRLDVFSRAEDGSESTIGGGEATAAHAGTQLTDTGALFQTDGVAIGDVIKNLTTGAQATVSSITSETILQHSALTGGSRATWAIDDNYAIGVKITTAGAYSALKIITFTPNGISNPVHFEPDDITLGNPTTFLVFAFDTFNEEVAEPFLWRLEGV